MPSRKPSKNDQIDTKLLPDAKIGAVPRGTQFSQIPMFQCEVVHSWVTSTLIRVWLDYLNVYICKNIPVLSIETYNCSKFASWLVFAPVILKKIWIFARWLLFEPIFFKRSHQSFYSNLYFFFICTKSYIHTTIKVSCAR